MKVSDNLKVSEEMTDFELLVMDGKYIPMAGLVLHSWGSYSKSFLRLTFSSKAVLLYFFAFTT